LGKPVKEEDIQAMTTHLSFDKMKSNPAVNKQELVEDCNKLYEGNVASSAFMRQGKAGNWKSHLSDEQVKRFQEWERKWLEGSDLKFSYE